MRDLRAGHLERAVARQHERTHPRPELRAERARHAEAHRGVESLRQVAAGAPDAHVEAGEEHVARLRDHEMARMLAQEAVHLAQQTRHLERRASGATVARGRLSW